MLGSKRFCELVVREVFDTIADTGCKQQMLMPFLYVAVCVPLLF